MNQTRAHNLYAKSKPYDHHISFCLFCCSSLHHTRGEHRIIQPIVHRHQLSDTIYNLYLILAHENINTRTHTRPRKEQHHLLHPNGYTFISVKVQNWLLSSMFAVLRLRGTWKTHQVKHNQRWWWWWWCDDDGTQRTEDRGQPRLSSVWHIWRIVRIYMSSGRVEVFIKRNRKTGITTTTKRFYKLPYSCTSRSRERISMLKNIKVLRNWRVAA